jgi:hypothetical protein
MKAWLRSLVGKVGLAEYLVPAFKFQCDMCGETIAAPVPKPMTWLNIRCKCGHEHKMVWTGEFWKYQNPAIEKEYVPPPFGSETDQELAKGGVDILQRKQQERG